MCRFFLKLFSFQLAPQEDLSLKASKPAAVYFDEEDSDPPVIDSPLPWTKLQGLQDHLN